MNRRHVTAALLAPLVLGAGAAPDGVPADDQGDAGPPGDLPGRVPDFVGGIHDRVGGFLNGSIDSLGDAVSGVAPDGDGGDG